ncbi:hypothetical protein E4U41_001267 [Claviceps citrina]|nr:hypothetical protein E4U41_001267 [Claviceps citrina]
MCFAARICLCGTLVQTNQPIRCQRVPLPLAKRKAFIAGAPPARVPCPGVYIVQGSWPPLESCPACACERRGEGHGLEDDDDGGDTITNALERHDSYGSATDEDDVPSLSRDSRSTWTSGTSSTAPSLLRSLMPPASCPDDEAEEEEDEDPRIRIVSPSPDASQQDLAVDDEAITADTMYFAPATALPLSHGHGHDYDHDTDAPSRAPSPSPASSPRLGHHPHRYRFARFLGWTKQTKQPPQQQQQHRRNRSDPLPKTSSRPGKKSKSRWKAIVLRNRSVDSDKSFVCRTARAMQNQEAAACGHGEPDHGENSSA